MATLKDAGESIMKYGEMLFSKAEQLARIGKLNLDIRRIQLDIGIAEKELGRYVISQIDSGASSINSSDEKVKEIMGNIKSLKQKVESKKSDIEKIKAEADVKKTNGGHQ